MYLCLFTVDHETSILRRDIKNDRWLDPHAWNRGFHDWPARSSRCPVCGVPLIYPSDLKVIVEMNIRRVPYQGELEPDGLLTKSSSNVISITFLGLVFLIHHRGLVQYGDNLKIYRSMKKLGLHLIKYPRYKIIT